MAKGHVGKGLESGEIWDYRGSLTAVPSRIKLLTYNLVIGEVPRRAGWILVCRSCVCPLKGYLAPFMDTMGILSLWNNTCGRNWKICTQQLCAWLPTIWDAEKSRICLSSQLCCL